jgi:preprotein translocase subunit Sec61beta
VAKAVFWSFFGVRKSKHHDEDAVTLTPTQVIVAGIIGAALLVFCLIMLVRVVTR